MERSSGLGWALAQTRPYRGRLVLLTLLSAAEVGLRVLLPWPMKAIVDDALTARQAGTWLAQVPPLADAGPWRLLIVLVAVSLLLQVTHQAVLLSHTRLFSATGHLITRDLRQRLFAHLQGLSLLHHSRTPVGDSMYRLESDATCLEQLLLRGVLPLTFSALTLIVMFAILSAIDLSLALVSLGIVPFLFVWIRYSARRLRPGADRARQLESRMSVRMHESFAAIRLVKSFAREPYEGTRFSGAATEAMRARVGLSTREAVFSSVVGAMTTLGTSLVVLFGGMQVLAGELSVGTLLVALAYLGFVYGPLSGIATTTGTLQQALAAARRVEEVFALRAEAGGQRGAHHTPRLSGLVEFVDVHFAYDGHFVLQGVSCRVEPGELIAVVGPSGSGKTTLVSMIPGFYTPDRGEVRVDGVNVSDYDLSMLRQQVAIVLQEALVLSGSVRENLRYGRLDATDADIVAAARAANAHDFIMALPLGYDTELGEAGSGLSGGQRQRLSIARAFLKDAPILVLDEPTASLDTIAEDAVFDAVRRLRMGRTTFVIAHRLSTVRQASRIIVLEGGRIQAEGTHDVLLSVSPLYARLAAQMTFDDGG